MKKEDELFGSLKKLNNRLTLLEDCLGVLEQRITAVEDLNRLNEKNISKNFQELNSCGVVIKDLKLALNSFIEDNHSEPNDSTA